MTISEVMTVYCLPSQRHIQVVNVCNTFSGATALTYTEDTIYIQYNLILNTVLQWQKQDMSRSFSEI